MQKYLEQNTNGFERHTNALQFEVQIDVERNTKALRREIQMDMERNTNGCGPSYQPADGGGWIVAASTHKTNISENYIGG